MEQQSLSKFGEAEGAVSRGVEGMEALEKRRHAISGDRKELGERFDLEGLLDAVPAMSRHRRRVVTASGVTNPVTKPAARWHGGMVAWARAAHCSAFAASHMSSYECWVVGTPSSSAIAARTLLAKSPGFAASSADGVNTGRYVTVSTLYGISIARKRRNSEPREAEDTELLLNG